MEVVVKKFDELSVRELHALYAARCQVFIVEQNCPYQDIDGVDLISWHVFLRDERGLAACARIFPRDTEPGVVQIGRVLTLRRGEGLGRQLMDAAIAAVHAHFPGHSMYLEAQVYATGFYENHGFAVTSGEFDEDGIPHVEMRRSDEG